MSTRIESRIQLTAALVFSLMALVGLAQYLINSKVAQSMESVKAVAARERTYADLLSMLRDAETGQRGFVITGQERFLEPYQHAVATIPGILHTLIEGTPASGEKRVVEQISVLTRQKLGSAAESIALRREHGAGTAATMVSTGIGKMQMDKLRKVIGDQLDLLAAERATLRESLTSDIRTTALASGTATALNILLMVGMLVAGRRLLQEKMSATSTAEALSRDLTTAVAIAEKRNHELDLSAEMLHVLESVATLDQTAEVLESFFPRLLPRHAGAVYLYRHARDVLELHAHWGAASDQPTVEPDNCWALRRGTAHRHLTESDLMCKHLHDASQRHLCIPLITHGEVIGMMTVAGDDADAADLQSRMVQSVAEQAALALANVKLREALRTQSVVDPLTGLYNRRYLDETLLREVIRSKRRDQALSLVMIDIDHFKSVNDTHGHDGGDAVLREVACVLRDATRGSDVVCRYGGEEMVILLPECDADTAAQRAEVIRHAIARCAVRQGGATLCSVTASFGVASFPAQASTAEELVKAADLALYEAKRTGRNRVVSAAAHHAVPIRSNVATPGVA